MKWFILALVLSSSLLASPCLAGGLFAGDYNMHVTGHPYESSSYHKAFHGAASFTTLPVHGCFNYDNPGCCKPKCCPPIRCCKPVRCKPKRCKPKFCMPKFCLPKLPKCCKPKCCLPKLKLPKCCLPKLKMPKCCKIKCCKPKCCKSLFSWHLPKKCCPAPKPACDTCTGAVPYETEYEIHEETEQAAPAEGDNEDTPLPLPPVENSALMFPIFLGR